MIIAKKIIDDPKELAFEIEEELNATYELESIDFLENPAESSLRITLYLNKLNENPSEFFHSFTKVITGFEGIDDLTTIIELNESNDILAHRETTTHIARPFANPSN